MDEIIKYCSARIVKDSELHDPIGSGVLIRQEGLGEKIYLITAAHCLREEIKAQLSSIRVEVYNPSSHTYTAIRVTDLRANSIMHADEQKDVAIVALPAKEVLTISPDLPSLPLVFDRVNGVSYKCAGFPLANKCEFDQTNAWWINEDMASNRMFFHVENDYIQGYMRGFSGGGIFCETHNEVMLLGIMTEYRKEEAGRILYGEGLTYINELLYASHYQGLSISYLVSAGVTAQKISNSLVETYADLGERFIQDFNVPSSIQERLDAACRTQEYCRKIEDIIDQWLESQHSFRREGNDELTKGFAELRADVLSYVSSISKHADADVDVSAFIQKTDEFVRKIDDEFDNASNARKKVLTDIRDYCVRLDEDFREMDLLAANSNFVIVEGESGCGKSHLLGHISKMANEQGCPALLFIGEKFTNAPTIEENIIRLLQVPCSFDELAMGLDRIGKRIGRRVPILIDALNETQPMTYWKSRLGSFVKCLSKYRNTVLIVTIRDTYLKRVLSSSQLKQWENCIFRHEGFRDSEHIAMKCFCKYYHLTALSVPVLNPEYSIPLYLHMACKIAVETGHSELPMGSDMHALFDAYIQLLEERFENQREEYIDRSIVSDSVRRLTRYMFEKNQEYIELAECQDVLQIDKVSYRQNVLTDLLGSSLLSKERDWQDQEYVRFTYQRMSDYFIAKMLLEECATAEDVKKKLSGITKKLTTKHSLSGVLEQLFVMIPDRFDVEIWEVMDLQDFQDKVRMLLRSLHWRSPGHIHAEQITDYLQDNGCHVTMWWDTLLFLAPVPNHPFNGDRWHSIMKRQPNMAERDAMIQYYILESTRWNRDNNIQSLINWAWTKGISHNVNKEVARLVSITLAWLLSSTDQNLRDQVTKALVNLLQYQPSVLLTVLNEFIDLDDAYIRERILGVAYGCVLRCEQKEEICAIGRLVYNKIFASGNPPAHLLLRDYACNIVDYAHRQCGLNNVNMDLVLPPYNAQMPICPTKQMVDRYMVSVDDASDKYAPQQNAILYSLYAGLSDFGHKIVEPNVKSFVPWSFRIESEFEDLLKQCRGHKREVLKLYIDLCKQKTKRNDLWYGSRHDSTKAEIDKLIAMTEELLQQFMPEEFEKLKNSYIPNHLLVGTSRYANTRDALPYQYWIVQRVFELGYDRNMHGWYDKSVQRIDEYRFRDNYAIGRIERIGKKYERIAYWELMGCFADNYYIEHPWNTTKKIVYDGAWQNFWRDCDPACITKRVDGEKVESWTDYPLRCDWDLPNNEWLRAEWALNDVRQILLRKDETGDFWVTMHDDRTEHAPKILNGSNYHYDRFFNYHITAYLIHKANKEKFVSIAGEENFMLHEIARHVDSHTYYITKEKYWSRACDVDKVQTRRIWDKLLSNSSLKVMVPYVNMSGDPEDDKSGTRATYFMPIEKLFRDMHIQYADTDGDFMQDNVVCATCNPNRTHHYLMRRDTLQRYLDANGLDIIWLVNCERIHSNDSFSFQRADLYYHSGLFYLDDNGELQGAFKVQNRDDIHY